MPSAARAEETVLAFDFGERRTGVALGNTLLRAARPLVTLEAASNDRRFGAIAALIGEWHPQRLVVGIPAHPDGTPHALTARCQRFANQLAGRFNLPVERIDERYTSVEAAGKRRAALRDHAGRGKPAAPAADDAAAAALILQSWFDHAETPAL